jgi:cytochrome c oxidase assembly factor CtaG
MRRTRIISLLSVAFLALPARALACAAHHTLHAREVAVWWTFDPFVLPPIALLAVGYFVGLRKLRARAVAGGGPTRWQQISYAAGVATTALALWSPLDRLSDIAFAAHMTQHELLMLVAAPLIVLGQPHIPLLWALPAHARSRVAATVRRRAVKHAWRWIADPFVALIVHGLVVWAWHIPRAFEAALANDAIHAVQHASFFATAAVFFWSLTRGRYGRAGYGLAALYVFVTALHTGILGVILTVANRTWYPTHATRSLDWSLDPIEDQQLAGLIMWVPAGVLLAVLALALLAAWIGESERRVHRREQAAQRVVERAHVSSALKEATP